MATEEKILERIQRMLERANHPNTPEPERELCLQRADKLMLEHAIDQALIDSRLNESDRRKPVVKRIHVFDSSSPYRSRFRTILREIGSTYRVRIALHPGGDATIVGYHDDVQWCEMLWLHIFREFVAKIDPRWELAKTFDQNVRALKEAGRKWADIWVMGSRHNEPMPCECPPKDGGYLIRAYRRQCKADGVEPNVRTQRHDAYRLSFTEAFTDRICARLEASRHAAKEDVASSGAELVLANASVVIDEVFYTTFPDLRPESPEEMRARQEAERAQREREQEQRAAWLASLSDERRQQVLEEEERERRRKAAADERWWRNYEKEQAKKYDGDGSRAGRAAADEVRIDRSTDLSGANRGEIGS